MPSGLLPQGTQLQLVRPIETQDFTPDGDVPTVLQARDALWAVLCRFHDYQGLQQQAHTQQQGIQGIGGKGQDLNGMVLWVQIVLGGECIRRDCESNVHQGECCRQQHWDNAQTV